MARRFDVVAYLKLFRFPLVFTAMSDSLAGYLVVGQFGLRPWPVVLLLMGASAGLYFFGMALNDLADRDKDRQGAPNKVIPSGRVSPVGARIACGLALAGSLVCILSIPRISPWPMLVVWGLALISILAYDLHWLKTPALMGLVRSFNFLLGISVLLGWGNTYPLWELAILVLPEFVYVSALTFVSTLEDGELDRSKLMIGVSLMAFAALAAALLAPAWSNFHLLPDTSRYLTVVSHYWHGLTFASILAAWTFYRGVHAKDKKGIMLMVRDGVGGIIILNAAMVASRDGAQSGAVIAALTLPAAISVSVFKRLA